MAKKSSEAGKGDANRVKDLAKYRENYEKIFCKKKIKYKSKQKDK